MENIVPEKGLIFNVYLTGSGEYEVVQLHV